MVVFSLSFCLGTSQKETQMKGFNTRGGMVANVDVSTARQPISRGCKPQKASASETWSNVADKLGARPGGSDKEDMDFEMAEIKSSKQCLQRFKAKCALTYPTKYFSPLEDEEDLVGNSLDHHSTDSYLSSSPNSCSKDKLLAESLDSVDD
ncbi:hypothetical protein CQW23_30953 [Capsicum baccatum]|uniref:Uncharacterized protein n=1 Tax=Capsicum baccatum TaxID=33114 RepID=A0A2G2V960_CAPBA|nr:hypothetical protein CQW23_30953 [Capsicum baccatum]